MKKRFYPFGLSVLIFFLFVGCSHIGRYMDFDMTEVAEEAAGKISDYNELAETPNASDLFIIVDVSDTSMAPTGTNKKCQRSNVVGGLQAELTNPVTSDGATTVENQVPQFTATNNQLKDSLGLVTTVGTPGGDTNLPTEQAVREALTGLKDVDQNIWQAVHVTASAMIADGTTCLDAAAQTLNSGPEVYVIDCSTDAAGTFDFNFVMPENWDGGNIFIELQLISDENPPSGTIEWDMSIQARGNDETVNATYVTTNGEIYFEDAETSNTTVDTQWDAFKCKNKTAMAASGAGGDTFFVRGTRDNDDATHDTSTQGIWILGATVFYQIDDMDEKD